MPSQSQTSSTVSTTPDFNEHNFNFNVCGRSFHGRMIVLGAGMFGFVSVCILFTLTLWRFTWTRYEESVDVLALTGFCVFLVSGTFVHVCVVLAVKKNDATLLNPSLIFHLFLILIELIMAFTSIGELSTDSMLQLDESVLLARQILFMVPPLIFCNSAVLYILLKFRSYLLQQRRSSGIHGAITPVFFAETRFQDGMAEAKPVSCHCSI